MNSSLNLKVVNEKISIIGDKKNILEICSEKNSISDKLKNCEVLSLEIKNNSEIFLNKKNDFKELIISKIIKSKIKKFDFILITGIISKILDFKMLLKELKEFLDVDGKIIFDVPNVTNIVNRLKFLNGEFNYESEGLIENEQLRFYTLNSILINLETSGYSLSKLSRIEELIDIQTRTDIIPYSITSELLDSLHMDFEAKTFYYIICVNISNQETINDTKKWNYIFPTSITTDRLKAFFHYYKTYYAKDVLTNLENREIEIQQLQLEIKRLNKKLLGEGFNLKENTKKIVDDMYREILQRPADEEGFQYWGSLLENKKITIKKMQQEFYNSDEYKTYIKSKQ
jgi:hypothetical protein